MLVTTTTQVSGMQINSEGFGTDPDILRLMLNCSHMSDANKVSWGPTKLSSCSQNSLVSSTEAGNRGEVIKAWRERTCEKTVPFRFNMRIKKGKM